MTDEYDNAAIAGLLVRFSRLWREREAAQKAFSDASKRVGVAAANMANLKTAFGVFGYDINDKDVWQKVRDQLGDLAYHRALVAGREDPRPVVEDSDTQAIIDAKDAVPKVGTEASETQSDALKPEVSETKSEVDTVADDAASSSGATGEHSRTAVGDKPPPTVRDGVLEKLQACGAQGARASDLKGFLESAYSMKLHDKTVGMTLYRLSKEGLVRRDGRIWLFVPPVAETKNPGGDAPGSNNVLD